MKWVCVLAIGRASRDGLLLEKDFDIKADSRNYCRKVALSATYSLLRSGQAGPTDRSTKVIGQIAECD
jgi:hypothetical protein